MPPQPQPRGLTRRVNELLAERGLKWCTRCAPAIKNQAAMRKLIDTGRIPRRRCIKPLDQFPPGKTNAWWCLDCKTEYARRLHRRLEAEDPKRLHDRLRADYARLKNDPARLAAKRQRGREYARRKRARAKVDAAAAEALRASARRYRQGVRNDPVRHQRDLENRRIDARLRRERAGLPPTGRKLPARMGPDRLPRLPAKPLAEFIEQLGDVASVCQALGIHDRQHRAWSTGEIGLVQFDVADRVVTNAGATWFEVYDPERYPQVAAVMAG